jgi:AhpC/TSA antioxidant enzyme
LRDNLSDIRALGGDVAAIGTGDVGYAARFVTDEAIPYPVLVDDEGAAARAASVRTATPWGLMSPRSWGGTRSAWRHGFRIHRSGKRVRQLGGTFVIGPGAGPGPGIVRYEHHDAHSADHAPIREVLEALRSAAISS